MPDDATPQPPAIEVRDLHKHFGSAHVLRGVGVRAEDGDVVSLIGSSGSGKSTFLRCINMLETPSSGQIFLGGEELRLKPGRAGLMPRDRRQLEGFRSRLGMVFQSFNLWQHMTVLQNVIEGPVQILGLSRAEATDRAEAHLTRVGLWEKRAAYPAYLSGGQQQRVAIARALAMDPRVMLFDEPTSALDPELVGEVLKVIRELADEGRTMLLVTHEMRFARDVSSRVLYLHQGQIEEEGPPEQVFGDPRSDRCRSFVASVH